MTVLDTKVSPTFTLNIVNACANDVLDVKNQRQGSVLRFESDSTIDRIGESICSCSIIYAAHSAVTLGEGNLRTENSFLCLFNSGTKGSRLINTFDSLNVVAISNIGSYCNTRQKRSVVLSCRCSSPVLVDLWHDQAGQTSSI